MNSFIKKACMYTGVAVIIAVVADIAATLIAKRTVDYAVSALDVALDDINEEKTIIIDNDDYCSVKAESYGKGYRTGFNQAVEVMHNADQTSNNEKSGKNETEENA